MSSEGNRFADIDTLPELRQALRELSERYEFVIEDVTTVENRLDAIEEKLGRLDDIEERVQELDARTDMLRLVEDADDLDGKQRSAAILQHLQRAATRNGKGGGIPKAKITKERVEEILHFPDIDRTTFYSDMERCERLVGDDGVCEYDGGPPATLTLDLRDGDVPASATDFGGGD